MLDLSGVLNALQEIGVSRSCVLVGMPAVENFGSDDVVLEAIRATPAGGFVVVDALRYPFELVGAYFQGWSRFHYVDGVREVDIYFRKD